MRWPLLAGAVALGAGLVGWELRAETPFIDVRMLVRNPAVTTTYGRMGATFMVFYGVFYGLPLWLEAGRGLTSLESGLVMLPVAGLGVVTTLAATRLSDRYGLRLVLVIGTAALLVGSLTLFAASKATPLAALVLICAVLGIPNGFNSLGNQSALYEAAPADQIGTASGLLRTSHYVGADLASAVVGLTLTGAATDSGLHTLALVIGLVSACLLVGASTSRHLRRTPAAPNSGLP